VTNENTIQAIKKPGFWIGLILFTCFFFISPESTSLTQDAWFVLAVMTLMVVWWLTETISIYVTALIPLILLPILTSANFQEVALPYANQTIFLFLGGFILAIAIEKVNLHKRFAYFILSRNGTTLKSILFSFMIIAYLTSMWIINTATAMMLLPIATYVCRTTNSSDPRFEVLLLLGIAYGATIGGMATIVGTAPNIFFVGYMAENYDIHISFYEWSRVALPLSLVILMSAYLVLAQSINKNSTDHKFINTELTQMSKDEKKVALIFILTIGAWVFRGQLTSIHLLSELTDAGIAITAAFFLFITPSQDKKKELLEWRDMQQLPWGLILLFGGGLALAKSIMTSGLASWIGNNLEFLTQYSAFTLVLILVICVIFLTEILSNTALTLSFLPIVSIVAINLQIPVQLLGTILVIAASCAFMLPIATPPNAVIFASGKIRVYEMAKKGIILNIISIFMLIGCFQFLIS
jgi:solute carrier family 13 (sodium-dependent dicarboxylate transporter), member 2/3/5